ADRVANPAATGAGSVQGSESHARVGHLNGHRRRGPRAAAQGRYREPGPEEVRDPRTSDHDTPGRGFRPGASEPDSRHHFGGDELAGSAGHSLSRSPLPDPLLLLPSLL